MVEGRADVVDALPEHCAPSRIDPGHVRDLVDDLERILAWRSLNEPLRRLDEGPKKAIQLLSVGASHRQLDAYPVQISRLCRQSPSPLLQLDRPLPRGRSLSPPRPRHPGSKSTLSARWFGRTSRGCHAANVGRLRQGSIAGHSDNRLIEVGPSGGPTEHRTGPETEDTSVARHQPVTAATRCRSHPHDRVTEPDIPRSNRESGAPEAEDSAVRGDQPVARP